MEWSENVTLSLEALLDYAEDKQLIEALDRPYYRNLLLDVMAMEAPADVAAERTKGADTATALLNRLCDLACEKGLCEDLGYAREMLATRLMGVLTPSPREVRQRFLSSMNAGKAEEATNGFYEMCRDCNYIKVDAIAQNIRYFSDTPCGELEITINLSKPEKDPREIAKLKQATSVSYPKCMLCVENPGYAGRNGFPPRQNHRIVPIKLAGKDWYIQYSPYAYYPEHCIVFNSQHVPMRIDRGTFERLFALVSQMPHYFLGSNADLPIVGGSILNHDHFQGGRYTFPMDHAPVKQPLVSPDSRVTAGILDWPMSTIVLEGKDTAAMVDAADAILTAWRSYSDPDLDIVAESGGEQHHTITPALRKVGDHYRLLLVLRDNNVSAEHPLGIFHPHAALHHIKKENIGLIEVMGMFILPGRLKTELTLLTDYLTGTKPLTCPAEDDPSRKHFDWVKDIVSRRGLCATEEEAKAVLRQEAAAACAQVLADAGVYKQDETGMAGMLRFLDTLGYSAT